MKTNLSAEVQALHTDCLHCKEAIFNPICPVCLFQGFKAFISKYPEIEERIGNDIIRFLHAHKIIGENTQTCVACNRNRTYMCPYCFTEYLFNLLKEAKAEKKVLGEFLLLFNFDFEHYGYYKEGEDLGVF